jgi:hypothetical protein
VGRQAFLVQLGEAGAQLAQFGLHARQRALGQHPVGEGQRLLGLVEAAVEEVVEAFGAEVLADRPIGKPVEIARHVQADATPRHQRDQVQAVQVQQLLQALRLRQLVDGQHVPQRPVIQRADSG